LRKSCSRQRWGRGKESERAAHPEGRKTFSRKHRRAEESGGQLEQARDGRGKGRGVSGRNRPIQSGKQEKLLDVYAGAALKKQQGEGNGAHRRGRKYQGTWGREKAGVTTSLKNGERGYASAQLGGLSR